MSATPRVVLGADTLARKWWLDVNTGTHAAPAWAPVGGVSDFKFSETKTFQEDSDYDSGGAKSKSATAYEWSIECKLRRKVTAADPLIHDPGQEAIRTACKRTTGLANVVEVRWYEMNVDDDGDVIGPAAEAYQGYTVAQWAEDGGPMDALDTVSVQLQGRGAYADITHPEGAAVVPVLYSVSPAVGVTAGGTLHKLTGKGFMLNGVDDVVASTGIKLGGSGGTAATHWIVESDNVLYFVAPAITSGTKAVVVYNSVGISTVTVNVVIS
jgi:hypothetical protein